MTQWAWYVELPKLPWTLWNSICFCLVPVTTKNLFGLLNFKRGTPKCVQNMKLTGTDKQRQWINSLKIVWKAWKLMPQATLPNHANLSWLGLSQKRLQLRYCIISEAIGILNTGTRHNCHYCRPNAFGENFNFQDPEIQSKHHIKIISSNIRNLSLA